MARLDDEDIMPWKPHRGKPLRDVPKSFWAWCLRQPWFTAEDHEDLYEYAKRAVRRPESYDEAVRMLMQMDRRPMGKFETRLEIKERGREFHDD
jgi:hypothetical protein